MNYLFQFLSVLNHEEILKLKNIDLVGKEKKLLEVLIEYKNKNLPKDVILEKFQFSENHFYKTCSILLDKCYQYLFDNNVFATLKFLSKRDLYQNLKHEIFQQEKKFQNDLNFYLLTFELSQRGSYKNHEEDVIQYLAQKIIELSFQKENLKKDIKYFVEVRRIRSKIFELAALQKIEEASVLKVRLLELEPQLSSKENALSLFHLYHALYNYYNFFESSAQNPEKFLYKALKVSEAAKEYLELEDIIITQCKIAENLYYQSHFKQAYDSYYETMKQYPEIFLDDFYHLSKFVQLCLIIENFHLSEEILQKYFLNYLQILHPTRGTMAALNYTKFFLLQQDFKEANFTLQKARFLNDKNFYLPYEFEIRLLESTLVFLTEDFEFLVSNLKKQYKYFKNKGLKPKESNYVNYLRFLEKIAKMKKNKKNSLDKEFQTIYETFQKGSYAVYGKLMDLCIHNKAKF